MASLRSYGWILVVAGWGCAAQERDSAGADDDTEAPYQLTWVDPSDVVMLPGESRTVGVVYTDPYGNPVVDSVSFALVGEAQDASLDALERTTDSDGKAEVTIFASSSLEGATFRLRATAPLAEEEFLDVLVSATGVGALGVTPRYVGHRVDIDARDARILSRTTCAELDPLALPPGDRSLPVEDVDQTWVRVEFPTLAPGVPYAAVVTGTIDGSAVAYGCVDGILVVDQETTEVEVVVDDLSPSPIGEYDIETLLDLVDAVTDQPSAWLEPTRTLLGDDPTSYLAERIADYVEATYDAAARTRFETAVGDASALRAELESPEHDPRLLVDGIAADVESALLHPVLHSVLTIDPGDGGFDGLHSLDSIEVDQESIGLAADARIAFTDLSLVSQAPAAVTANDASGIDIGTHSLELPVGTIAAAIAERVLPARDGAADLAGLIAQTIDCTSVADTLAGMGADADCDATCLADACVEASTHLASSVSSDLSSANESLGRVEWDGSATLVDEGGDLRAELLISGLFIGSFTPAGSILAGSFVGTRIESPAE
jgi:hypothetical protein